MSTVLIRADSSSTIGTGHIMRDIVLAKREFPHDRVIFAVRDLQGNINHKIDEAGYERMTLESDDIDELTELVSKHRADTVVIDHYGIGYEDEKRLKEQTGATLFVLDDTYEKHYCDILLNPNVYADSKHYRNLVPKHCELRCGPKYMLLRDEFIEAKTKKNHPLPSSLYPKKLQVFIAMGGADTINLNIPILETLKEYNEIHAHVVTTRANRNLEELRSYAKNHDHVTLHIETGEIAKLMSKADFAIITPSMTINEVIFMDLPFIAIQTANNQKEMSSYLKEKELALLEKFDEEKFKSELSTMVDFLHTELVDFTQLSRQEKLEVLEWRNSPSVRRWMLNQQPVESESHFSFIDALKNRSDSRYFLVKAGEESIGVIDFTNIDRTKKCAHIGLYANPSKKGVGKLLICKIIEYATYRMGFYSLKAEVFKENKRAFSLLSLYGFKKVKEKKIMDRMIVIMEKKL